MVAHLLASGAPDPSFSQDGYVLLPLGTQAGLGGVLSLPDHQILAAGSYATGRLASYDQSGNLVGDFGRGGIASFPHALISSIAMTPGGKILVVAGHRLGNHAYVMRLKSDGRIDKRFGDRGSRRLRRGAGGNVLVQPSGTIFVGGGFSAERLSPNGTPDRSFGDRGRARIRIGTYTAGGAMAFQGKKLLFAGSTSFESRDDDPYLVLVRIKTQKPAR